MSLSPTISPTSGVTKMTMKSYRPPMSPKKVILSYATRFYSLVVVSSHIFMASMDS